MATRRGGSCMTPAKNKRNGAGIQQWTDGSRYKGEFVDGLKQGGGVFIWANGEIYEGSFYKDYRHGRGTYSWPDGSRFTGRFYLNRKEGYGVHIFPDGTTFEGLYHADERFGPGVITYADGRQDVGVWYRQWLLRLCTRVEEAFMLQNVSDYVARLPKQECVTQARMSFSVALFKPGLEKMHVCSIDTSLLDGYSLLEDEWFILPPDIHSYSTDSDHLPITHHRKQELDLHFFGRSDVITPSFSEDLTLQLRIEAHVHTHRFEAKGLCWDIGAVLAMNRGPFGPRGPLELSSERLIREASFGNHSAVHNILQGGNVHPDVSDSGGFTALIAATMTCYDNVINLLLDSGADVNKLNDEGMSALAVCALLYYPFQGLHEKIRAASGITNIPQKVSADSMGEMPGHKRERELLTGSQTDQKEHDPPGKSFSNAKAPKSPENTECIESPKRAGKILQGAKAQVVEAELSEKVELDADSFYGEQDLDLKAERNSWTNESTVDLTVAFDSANFIASFDKNLTDDIVLQMPKALCQGDHVKLVHMQETVRKMTYVKIEHQVHWSTLKLLLDRGADPNASSVPMPVIFLAIKAGHVEGVQRLLEFGARIDLPLSAELKGLYPLHVAAGLIGPVGPKITELLLHVAADPDVKAQDASEVFELDKSAAEADVGCGARSPQGSGLQPYNYTTSATMEGGRTPLHVACQKDSDYTNARDVVSILLSHKANTNHLWSGHSPLSLAIASGNELAVDELLANGADPNLPLSRCVGSALCAAANFNYDCASHPRNRVKLVEKLCKAGANILMPVMVGEGHRCTFGTAVDYAHHTFNQNWRIAHTPYHALNQHDREAYNTRSQLLSTMVNLLRQAANSMEKQCLEQSQGIHKKFVFTGAGAVPPKTRARAHHAGEQQRTWSNDQRKPLFKYCYQCGRSAWVVLMACSRCHEVFYCSKMCKMKAWNERHKVECSRVPGTGSVEGRHSSGEQGHTLSGKSSSKHQDYHVRLDKPGSSKTRSHSPQHDPKENYSFV